MFKSFKLYLYRLSLRFKALSLYIADYSRHIRFSVNYHREDKHSQDMIKCSIMLLNHQLEKAQTYVNAKDGYGREKVRKLVFLSEKYVNAYGYDSVVYTSLGVIKSHLNNEFSYKDDNLKERYNDLLNRIEDKSLLKDRGGIGHISGYFRDPNLLKLLQARHSCRTYSNQIITLDEIKKAIEYAMTAPSACNRQSIRTHYFNNPQKIESIVMAQKSDINWCLRAKGLFIITSNQSFFRDYYERNQRMFDAGLFSMNLVLGLHNQGIGSCFKMAQKDEKIDKLTKKIAGIPDIEDICVLVLFGKYPEDERIYAKSSRLDLNEILTFHN